MAHLALAEVPVTVIVDVQHARRAVRRVLSLAQEANRELAKVEESLNAHYAILAKFGITLEVDA